MKNSEWVQDKEDRVEKIEDVISSVKLGTFIGTMEEYNTAKLNGQINNGMFIVITKKNKKGE